MVQQMRKSVKVALTKGLITEATPLTFPEDATTAELNVDFERDGHRPKRRGFNIEQGGTMVPIPIGNQTLFQSFAWEFVGGDKTLSLLVLQVGATLHFFDMGRTSLSEGFLGVSRDLSAHLRGEITQLSFTTIRGDLIVAGESLDTLRIEWNSGNPILKPIVFRIRDFEYLTEDRRTLTERGARPAGIVRQYDSFNSGWLEPYWSQFLSRWSGAPELTKPYYSTKNTGGWTTIGDWDKIQGGNTLITNGRFVLNLYTMDRDTASGIIGVNSYVAANRSGLGAEQGRFSTVANYAGRIFYSGMNSKRSMSRVYFSQVVQDSTEVGDLFSVNDPTAEYLSDLLDTDGGYVDLPDAEGITKLHVYGTHLLVFATNGVWAISGVDDVFRATNYTVNRITSLGLRNNATFVSAQGRPYWWSDVGIHTIAMTEFKNLEEQSITETTIKTFFLGIPDPVRDFAKGSYDERKRRVYWHYGSLSDPLTHSNLLILDEYAGAFAPWAIATDPSKPSIVSSFYSKAPSRTTITDYVVASNGEPVVDQYGEPVLGGLDTEQSRPSSVYFIVEMGNSIGFASFWEDTMYDWGDLGYDAYAESGYNFLGDLSGHQNAPYVTVLCKRTETTWGEEGPLNQSSLKVSAYWDFKTTPAMYPQEAYRIPRFIQPTALGQAFESEHTNVQCKIAPRGRGKALKLRFEGEHGKDFRLLGFETTDAKNRNL